MVVVVVLLLKLEAHFLNMEEKGFSGVPLEGGDFRAVVVVAVVVGIWVVVEILTRELSSACDESLGGCMRLLAACQSLMGSLLDSVALSLS